MHEYSDILTKKVSFLHCKEHVKRSRFNNVMLISKKHFLWVPVVCLRYYIHSIPPPKKRVKNHMEGPFLLFYGFRSNELGITHTYLINSFQPLDWLEKSLQGCFKIWNNIAHTEDLINDAPVYIVYIVMALTVTFITWGIMHNKLAIKPC